MVKKVTKTEVAETTVAETQVAEAAPKKTVAKAQPKKAPVKKTPAKAAKKESKGAKKEAAKDPRGPSALQIDVLKILAKKGPKSRTQLSEALGGKWIGSNLMGHHDPAQRKASSLEGRGLVKAEQHDIDGRDVVVYAITAAGKKLIG